MGKRKNPIRKWARDMRSHRTQQETDGKAARETQFSILRRTEMRTEMQTEPRNDQSLSAYQSG